ncbi:hypothetical protein CEP54_005816 [Fusarium duplospermum]|uniref:Uncharacterized protein n=1 Tax=Fusarium duplospermum TaxID=1325734 RepID=A0A428QAC6_9HYPO|nr:hypothetical protein CEP54_005816 [Fusarium duplospermum]
MSDMWTPDYDLYKRKSIIEMIGILTGAFGELEQHFPNPRVHSQVSRHDVHNLCEQFRKWVEDPDRYNAAVPDEGKQVRKHLSEIGSLLNSINNIYAGRCEVSKQTLGAADIFLNEVDSHLRSLHDTLAEFKKEKEAQSKEST